MPADPNRVESLFHRARELPPADRPAFLTAACGGDAELRGRVERLLAAADSLGEPATAALPADPPTATFGDSVATADHTPQPDAGTVLGGKYKLVEEIGEGGMGTVWMAQQTDPVKRAVAVKVIKAGMDSKAVLARFEAERQALALMDHPNIAKVLDGGIHDGRPFFVMELVKGDPVTTYCDARRLTPRQRLELFVPVCQAIQHAHMKGVIHRDIKPSNVLVAMYDDRPVPKVIDFGVAKAAGPTLTDKTLMTGFGAVVGTPEYMSPEQANLNNLDIDTRSDVYSLGVLLYELLTGTTPVDRKSLGKAALLEVLRIVREVEAPRPSAKLSSAGTPPSVAANRGTEPAKLSKLMKGELDWVLLKALEKDRTRRYESANGLATDIQRYLADEVVQARPPSASYRVRKFVRRHKGQVAATAAFLGLLLVAVGVSSWLAVKATRAEGEAKNNAEAFYGAMIRVDESLQQVELTAASQRVDADLVELKTDLRTGLLRLAGTLRSLPEPQTHRHYPLRGGGEIAFNTSDEFLASQRHIREFVTAAVLATGQEFAPLLAPITHDGYRIELCSVSPDGQLVLTLGNDRTARLWDKRTSKPIAVLRQDSEWVVKCSFSPDGRTVFTDDKDSVARLWDSADGKFRARTAKRENRYRVDRGNGEYEGTVIRNTRLLTVAVVATDISRRTPSWPTRHQEPAGPVELWDTMTGRFVARLDSPNGNIQDVRVSEDGRWVTIVEGGSTALMYSMDDGRLVTRFGHPDGHLVTAIVVSPDGRRVATVSVPPAPKETQGSSQTEATKEIRLWSTGTGVADTTVYQLSNWESIDSVFWADSGFMVSRLYTSLVQRKWAELVVYQYGQPTPILNFDDHCDEAIRQNENRIHIGGGRLFDVNNWQRLHPPAGRRYHPSLAQFAPNGRFVVTKDRDEDVILIDTETEKMLTLASDNELVGYQLGFGAYSISVYYNVKTRLTPTFPLEITPKALELWAQVAVRGELGSDGAFLKWDEATWEKKRQELAAVPPPHPDFPFPGYVATDKLHWLRAEYEAAADKDKPRLVAELLRRAEASGDKAEAVRWRAEWNRLNPEPAPPPRPVVK